MYIFPTGPNSSYPELFASETRNVGFSFQSSSNIVFVQALRECTYFFNISVMAISSGLLLSLYMCKFQIFAGYDTKLVVG